MSPMEVWEFESGVASSQRDKNRKLLSEHMFPTCEQLL